MRCFVGAILFLAVLVLLSLAGALWFFLLTLALPVFLLVKLVQSLLAARKAAREGKRPR